jgi:Inner membrane component of T3SS, cytoplasmic domain
VNRQTAASRQRSALRAVEMPLDATVIQGRNGMRPPASAQPPRLVVVSGPRAGAVVALGDGELTLGRGWDNDLVLPDVSVSRRHALLRRAGAEVLLVDQGSGNGTRVNGRMVERVRLRNGDEISLGDSVVQFVEAGAAALRGNTAGARARGPSGRVGSRAAACAGIAALLGATALGLGTGEASALRSGRIEAVLPDGEPAGEPELAGEAPRQTRPQTVSAAEPAAPDPPVPKPSLDPPLRQSSLPRRGRGPSPAPPRIIEAYVGGNLPAALERARAARRDPAAALMLARLDRFDSAWREGVAHQEKDRPAEAIAALEQADAADRALAAGRDSPLGREVRRALSSLHTRMALARAGGGEAGAAAGHLRSALAQDPGNEEAREQLARLVARAGEAYLSGYIAKDSDPEAARGAFRLVVAVLAATDETAIKARRWLDRLEGKTSGEEELAR